MELEAIIEAARAPLPGSDPAGSDLRLDDSPSSIYTRIRAQRSQAASFERQIRMGAQLETSWQEIWRPIGELAAEAFESHTKDLEIAVYLIECLVREHSLKGLSAGLQIVHTLLENFWEEAYPRTEDGNFEYRFGFLNALNGIDSAGTLIPILRNRALTNCDQTGNTCTLNHWIQCIGDSSTKGRASADRNRIHTLLFQTATNTPEEFFESQRQFAEESLQYLDEISAIVQEHCGPDMLHTSQISSELRTYIKASSTLLTHRNKSQAAELPEVDIEEEESMEAGSGNATNQPVIPEISTGSRALTRETAFAQLSQISAFFRQSEPHSPISYAIDNIIKWGDMPLSELVGQLIPDSSARQLFCMMTGVDQVSHSADQPEYHDEY